MIKQFENLNHQEIELLIKAPALVSVLAASGDKDISEARKAEALKMAHLKTFTADPLLLTYYGEVENNFKSFFEQAVHKYAPFTNESREALKKEVGTLNLVIAKLDKEYARTLHRSLAGYAEHVKKADWMFLDDFIFPLPLPGLND